MDRIKMWMGGDYTPLEHMFFAMAMQFGCALLFFPFWGVLPAVAAGGALGIGFFVGREHAQAETRWKKAWGQGTIWNAFDLRRWDRGSVMDLALPVVACCAVLCAVWFFGHFYWQ